MFLLALCLLRFEQEMIESIRQSVVYMAHTHDGARVAMNSLWHGTAKVRTRSNATTARAHAGVLLLQTVEKQPSLFSFFLHGSHLKNSARKQNLWAQNTRRESLIGFCLRKDSCTQFKIGGINDLKSSPVFIYRFMRLAGGHTNPGFYLY